jgi:hypothetical protein
MLLATLVSLDDPLSASHVADQVDQVVTLVLR